MATTPQAHITGTLDDGTSFDVQTTPADQIRFELTASKQGWPGLNDGAAFLWSGFLAWSACKRTGQTDLKWEAFRDSLSALDMDTDAGGDVVDPTEVSDPEPFD